MRTTFHQPESCCVFRERQHSARRKASRLHGGAARQTANLTNEAVKLLRVRRFSDGFQRRIHCQIGVNSASKQEGSDLCLPVGYRCHDAAVAWAHTDGKLECSATAPMIRRRKSSLFAPAFILLHHHPELHSSQQPHLYRTASLWLFEGSGLRGKPRQRTPHGGACSRRGCQSRG